MENSDQRFTGNIYIFQAFDVAEDINLEKIEQAQSLITRPLVLPKYFKNYHIPLMVELPHPHTSSRCLGATLHTFGVISLTYKIPFNDSLKNLKADLNELDQEYQEISVSDAHAVFKKIKKFTKQPRFFHLRTSYVVIQVDQHPNPISVVEFKEKHGGTIASLLRFETEVLSEYIKNDIIDHATGYYRGDLVIIDTDASFVYDDEFEDLQHVFEFANIQHLELQYYDQVLDKQINMVYQRSEMRARPIKAYLPMISSYMSDPISDLGLLKVEISAIIERLESGIKVSADIYVSDVYTMLTNKLELNSWKDSINNKLNIVKDIYTIHQSKIDSVREDLLTVLIIILIFIELVVGVLSYLK